MSNDSLYKHGIWREHEGAMPHSLPHSMMCKDELLYLFWLSKEMYTGIGEIIDAGCLRGASTTCLSAGYEQNINVSDSRPRIHSYDLFEYRNIFSHLFPETTLQRGDSFLQLFIDDLGEYRKYIEVNPGDITKIHWNGQPIEILFLDVVKSNEINNHVLREFFSCLIPQRSIVAQQDYFHFYCYWIHITMSYFSDYFEVLSSPSANTLAFLYKKAIPAEQLQTFDAHLLPNDEKITLMNIAVDNQTGLDKLHVMTAKARMLGEIGETEKAYEVVNEIFQSDDWVTSRLLRETRGVIRHIPGESLKSKHLSTIRLIEDWADRLNASVVFPSVEQLERVKSRPVLIWGAESTGIRKTEELSKHNISVQAYIDQNPALHRISDTKLPVMSPESFFNSNAGQKPYVFIASSYIRDIALQLQNCGYNYEIDYSF